MHRTIRFSLLSLSYISWRISLFDSIRWVARNLYIWQLISFYTKKNAKLGICIIPADPLRNQKNRVVSLELEWRSHSISDQSLVLKKDRDLGWTKILVCFVTAITLSKTNRFRYKKKVCFAANTMKDNTEW